MNKKSNSFSQPSAARPPAAKNIKRAQGKGGKPKDGSTSSGREEKTGIHLFDKKAKTDLENDDDDDDGDVPLVLNDIDFGEDFLQADDPAAASATSARTSRNLPLYTTNATTMKRDQLADMASRAAGSVVVGNKKGGAPGAASADIHQSKGTMKPAQPTQLLAAGEDEDGDHVANVADELQINGAKVNTMSSKADGGILLGTKAGASRQPRTRQTTKLRTQVPKIVPELAADFVVNKSLVIEESYPFWAPPVSFMEFGSEEELHDENVEDEEQGDEDDESGEMLVQPATDELEVQVEHGAGDYVEKAAAVDQEQEGDSAQDAQVVELQPPAPVIRSFVLSSELEKNLDLPSPISSSATPSWVDQSPVESSSSVGSSVDGSGAGALKMIGSSSSSSSRRKSFTSNQLSSGAAPRAPNKNLFAPFADQGGAPAGAGTVSTSTPTLMVVPAEGGGGAAAPGAAASLLVEHIAEEFYREPVAPVGPPPVVEGPRAGAPRGQLNQQQNVWIRENQTALGKQWNFEQMPGGFSSTKESQEHVDGDYSPMDVVEPRRAPGGQQRRTPSRQPKLLPPKQEFDISFQQQHQSGFHLPTSAGSNNQETFFNIGNVVNCCAMYDCTAHLRKDGSSSGSSGSYNFLQTGSMSASPASSTGGKNHNMKFASSSAAATGNSGTRGRRSTTNPNTAGRAATHRGGAGGSRGHHQEVDKRLLNLSSSPNHRNDAATASNHARRSKSSVTGMMNGGGTTSTNRGRSKSGGKKMNQNRQSGRGSYDDEQGKLFLPDGEEITTEEETHLAAMAILKEKFASRRSLDIMVFDESQLAEIVLVKLIQTKQVLLSPGHRDKSPSAASNCSSKSLKSSGTPAAGRNSKRGEMNFNKQHEISRDLSLTNTTSYRFEKWFTLCHTGAFTKDLKFIKYNPESKLERTSQVYSEHPRLGLLLVLRGDGRLQIFSLPKNPPKGRNLSLDQEQNRTRSRRTRRTNKIDRGMPQLFLPPVWEARVDIPHNGLMTRELDNRDYRSGEYLKGNFATGEFFCFAVWDHVGVENQSSGDDVDPGDHGAAALVSNATPGCAPEPVGLGGGAVAGSNINKAKGTSNMLLSTTAEQQGGSKKSNTGPPARGAVDNKDKKGTQSPTVRTREAESTSQLASPVARRTLLIAAGERYGGIRVYAPKGKVNNPTLLVEDAGKNPHFSRLRQLEADYMGGREDSAHAPVGGPRGGRPVGPAGRDESRHGKTSASKMKNVSSSKTRKQDAQQDRELQHEGPPGPRQLHYQGGRNENNNLVQPSPIFTEDRDHLVAVLKPQLKQKAITAVAFSPDGTSLISGDASGKIFVYMLPTGAMEDVEGSTASTASFSTTGAGAAPTSRDDDNDDENNGDATVSAGKNSSANNIKAKAATSATTSQKRKSSGGSSRGAGAASASSSKQQGRNIMVKNMNDVDVSMEQVGTTAKDNYLLPRTGSSRPEGGPRRAGFHNMMKPLDDKISNDDIYPEKFSRINRATSAPIAVFQAHPVPIDQLQWSMTNMSEVFVRQWRESQVLNLFEGQFQGLSFKVKEQELIVDVPAAENKPGSSYLAMKQEAANLMKQQPNLQGTGATTPASSSSALDFLDEVENPLGQLNLGTGPFEEDDLMDDNDKMKSRATSSTQAAQLQHDHQTGKKQNNNNSKPFQHQPTKPDSSSTMKIWSAGLHGISCLSCCDTVQGGFLTAWDTGDVLWLLPKSLKAHTKVTMQQWFAISFEQKKLVSKGEDDHGTGEVAHDADPSSLPLLSSSRMNKNATIYSSTAQQQPSSGAQQSTSTTSFLPSNNLGNANERWNQAIQESYDKISGGQELITSKIRERHRSYLELVSQNQENMTRSTTRTSDKTELQLATSSHDSKATSSTKALSSSIIGVIATNYGFNSRGIAMNLQPLLHQVRNCEQKVNLMRAAKEPSVMTTATKLQSKNFSPGSSGAGAGSSSSSFLLQEDFRSQKNVDQGGDAEHEVTATWKQLPITACSVCPRAGDNGMFVVTASAAGIVRFAPLKLQE
ncbi:unnamed protein product [Amoebophrya sp. A120]|nr:unnamed protein product [Amoebophrya sp. A120]|eukprot:GSA120T00016352001.1